MSPRSRRRGCTNKCTYQISDSLAETPTITNINVNINVNVNTNQHQHQSEPTSSTGETVKAIEEKQSTPGRLIASIITRPFYPYPGERV